MFMTPRWVIPRMAFPQAQRGRMFPKIGHALSAASARMSSRLRSNHHPPYNTMGLYFRYGPFVLLSPSLMSLLSLLSLSSLMSLWSLRSLKSLSSLFSFFLFHRDNERKKICLYAIGNALIDIYVVTLPSKQKTPARCYPAGVVSLVTWD